MSLSIASRNVTRLIWAVPLKATDAWVQGAAERLAAAEAKLDNALDDYMELMHNDDVSESDGAHMAVCNRVIASQLSGTCCCAHASKVQSLMQPKADLVPPS